MTDTAPDTGTTNSTLETPSEYPVGHHRNPASVATAEPTDDPDKEIAKWKELARKHEDRAKANSAAARELEELRKTTMTDQEKAAAAARAEGRVEALREVGGKLVDAEVRAAAAGRPVDVDALLEGLDRSRFIDEQGDADRTAITAWIDRVAPAPEEGATQPTAFDLGQGHRPDPSTSLGGDPMLRDLKAKLGIS